MMAGNQIFMQKAQLKLQKEEQANRTKAFEQQVKEFEFKRIKEDAERQVAPGILDALIQQGNVPGLQQATQNAAAQSPLGQFNQQTGGGAEVGLNPAQAQAVLGQFGGAQQLQQGAATLEATGALTEARRAQTASLRQETDFKAKTQDLQTRFLELRNEQTAEGIISEQVGRGFRSREISLRERSLDQDLAKFTTSLSAELESDFRRFNATFRQAGASAEESRAIASQLTFDSPTPPSSKEIRKVISDRFEQSLGVEDPTARTEFVTSPFETTAFLGRLGIQDPQFQGTISSILVQAKEANDSPEKAFQQIQEDLAQLPIAPERREAMSGAAYLFIDRAYGVSFNRGDPARKSAIADILDIIRQNPFGVMGGTIQASQ
jgi:hypothetical protein